MTVSPSSLPENALLQRYAQDPGCFTDCYTTQVPGNVDLADYVTAFYTTPLFRIERGLLWIVAWRGATNADAHAVAQGQTNRFSGWRVEDRTAVQLLMCDLTGNTRSWFMTRPTTTGTELMFGSAVVPPKQGDGRAPLGRLFRALMRFHKLYSRLLLSAARRRVMR